MWLKDAPDINDIFDDWTRETAAEVCGQPDAQAGRSLGASVSMEDLQQIVSDLNARASMVHDIIVAKQKGQVVAAPEDVCKLVEAAEWWAERATRWNNFWDADEDKPDRRVSPVHPCSEPPPLGELEDAPL